MCQFFVCCGLQSRKRIADRYYPTRPTGRLDLHPACLDRLIRLLLVRQQHCYLVILLLISSVLSQLLVQTTLFSLLLILFSRVQSVFHFPFPLYLEHLLKTSMGRQTLWHLPTVSVSLILGEARKEGPIGYMHRFFSVTKICLVLCNCDESMARDEWRGSDCCQQGEVSAYSEAEPLSSSSRWLLDRLVVVERRTSRQFSPLC